MNTIIDFLQSIPEVIWSGVIASLLTLGGVFLSNISQTHRLLVQLKHDSDEKSKELTAVLRRDVYLSTIHEFIKANNYLASLPNMDLTNVNIGEGLQGFFSASGKMTLVAEPKTVLHLNLLVTDYNKIILDLTEHLIQVGRAKTDIQIAFRLYEKANSEVERLIAEMAKANESGNPNPRVFEVLHKSCEFQMTNAQKHEESRREASLIFGEKSLLFQRKLFSLLKYAGPKQSELIIEMRRDLGLIAELDQLEAVMKSQWQEVEDKFDATLENLKNSSID
ncbi:MAG: hypothetical protein HGA87_06590 [Desulfobulbaceae bacterium]|nr:hypothetical protein [Desulfobulbaceae bacterium]